MVAAVERSAAPEANGRVHGFPAVLTSFVGRAAVLDEIDGQLGEHRLVTVTGPGGAGKTRLAAEVARLAASRFADGAWLAELAAVREPARVAAAVATALGVRDLPAVAAADALARALARRQLLLVLDNCEHVIGAAAELCSRLLLAADDVRVLATSREPLRIAGEMQYRLGPLKLPDAGDPATAAESEAVRLFADRARLADAGFALDDETRPAAARLVARLDGMPLAIELAAARVEALGVAQLLDRIDDRFTLLEAGDRLATVRQRSLAAAVEWSYRLLDEREQRVFRAVSVFPGPFTLEGAEAVAGAGALPAVLHLVDCSLLVSPRADPDGRSRYAMLETLRAYGAGLSAEAGEAADVETALAGYAVRVAEDAMERLADGGEAAAAPWLDAEDATLRHVLDWAMELDAAVAQRLAVALAWWWQLRGRLAGQVPLLREAVDRAPAGSNPWCLGRAWLGQASLDSADPAGALEHFTAVAEAVGDRGTSLTLVRCLSGRSATLLTMGRVLEATDDARRAVAAARAGDYPLGEALALAVLGLIACAAGDRVGAVQLARRAEQITADLHGPMVRMCSHLMSTVMFWAGDPAAAERVCAAALARARDAGDLWSLGNLLEKMVVLDLGAGRFENAAAHLREGLQTALRTGSRARVLEDLDCCGYLCAWTGRSAEAVTIWAAMVALQGREGFSAPLHPEYPEGWFERQEPLREARQALGPAQARAAEERGAAMSLSTAAEYALMLTADRAPPPGAVTAGGKLSPRERELVTLVAQGHTDAQIAERLYISVRTVGSHLDRIRDKTGCRRRADLTRLALHAGLV
jgi:predicted ATPase/DNA-binding CsgD family transcriptional regulator